MKNSKDDAVREKYPAPSTTKPSVTGDSAAQMSPEENMALAVRQGQQIVAGMNRRPKDFIPPY